MSPSANQAPDELTTLRELVSALQSALEETRKENSLLRQKINALCRRVFGSSGEKMPIIEQVIEPQEVIDELEQWRLIG